MNLLGDITLVVAEAFSSCGYDKKLAVTTLSNRPDLCQFTCNGAMAGAKIYKKSPIAIATEISDVLSKNEMFKEVTPVMPGFININLSDEYLECLINKYDNLENIVDKKTNEKIVLDFGGPNVAKPLHVGHMRTANIGESLKRIGKFLGYDLVSDVHLGDWGLQMGLVITEIKDRFPNLSYFQENYEPSANDISPVTVLELNEIYPAASAKSKGDDDFKARAYEATGKLQNHEKGYYDLWKQLVKISIEDIKRNYKTLNVSFDLWYGESTANDYVPKLLKVLEEQHLLVESEGALVVDVSAPDDKIEIPPCMIKKSDGSMLYSTSDLATIMQRKEDFDPQEILYVVDSRQHLHFTQVFRCAKKANLVGEDVNLELVGFGTMNGKDGKPYKTRDGGVMALKDLIKTMVDAAYIKIDENLTSEVTENEKINIAEKVGVAALKFGDLYNQRTKDYIFDMERFLSFEGKTGPYLLYSVARINSILRKAGDFQIGKINLYSQTETQLVLTILMTEDILNRTFNDRLPNYLCEHVYNITTLFSKFYNENKIITEMNTEKKNSWLNLLRVTKDVVISLLDLLAIETVEKM